MGFDTSIGSVVVWLDALPFDLSARTSRKRRYHEAFSPPSSTMEPSTPRASGSRAGRISTTPSLSSASSKRSKRSNSPAKLFPLYGVEGHRLVRDSLMKVTTSLSPTLRHLLGDVGDAASRHGIIPRRAKEALEKHIETTGQFDRLRELMFCDDSTWHGSCFGGEDLVRRAVLIASRSAKCSRMLSDEPAWNNHVHSPLLEMLVQDMQDGPNQGIFDFLSCTTTSIDLTYHRFPDAASRVDYVFHFLPEDDPTISLHDDVPTAAYPCFNWTTDRLLQQSPLGISIETKRYGGDTVKGEQQLGIWQAAHWEFLVSCVGQDVAESLEFLPGIVVQGQTWSLLVSTRRQGVTTILGSVEFGNTGSAIGVFQVLAGLRRLRRWSLDVLWPWYRHHLPGLQVTEPSY
ncbi:hypothetical protein F5144DRAFT_565708 [Chaetomium tenue]|uniref:Uncharacterized protein n=1 Tax=Chaetomium tenue TaxID=1854479 RepID=A0ACB7PC59_9PEZI|nr:hypothetical protein F5144DRAFT_565708 [Chaetomium globosum]